MFEPLARREIAFVLQHSVSLPDTTLYFRANGISFVYDGITVVPEVSYPLAYPNPVRGAFLAMNCPARGSAERGEASVPASAPLSPSNDQ